MKSQLAIARDDYLEGKGFFLWHNGPDLPLRYMRNRIEKAWVDGVTYGVTASVDTRCKVPAPGWMKGRL